MIARYLLVVLIGAIFLLNLRTSADREEQLIYKSWTIATLQTYAHRVDNFGVLGDDGLLVQWASPESIHRDCSLYSECNFVRLASMVPCSKGYRLDIELLDPKDATLSMKKLEPTIVPVGTIQVLEIDYRQVVEGGSILLVDATCGTALPRI